MLILIAYALTSWHERPDSLPDWKSNKTDPQVEDLTTSWKTREFQHGETRKKRGLTLLPGFNDINVAGVNSYQDNCANFIMNADKTDAVIELTREKDNPHDPNAIAVLGAIKTGESLHQLGYLPADKAAKIAEDFQTTLPIQGELRTGGVHISDNTVFIAINVVGPNAEERMKHKRAAK